MCSRGSAREQIKAGTLLCSRNMGRSLAPGTGSNWPQSPRPLHCLVQRLARSRPGEGSSSALGKREAEKLGSEEGAGF